MLLYPIRRFQLSRAKHRSLAGHSNISKFIARLLPHYEFAEDTFFNTDGVSADVVKRRQEGFNRLSNALVSSSLQSLALSGQASEGISDMQFVGRYRVPFQFSAVVQANLKVPSFIKRAQGVRVYDMDGRDFYDLTGSYGVNVLGHDFYRECVEQAQQDSKDMVSVLGNYHPSVADNVRRLKEISCLDEVSFHMSGTEAVMQAVRLARYHTRRRYAVRFCGAYHGWWGDVQPGVGNPSRARDTLTLADMSAKTLKVLASRKDIACVLVNPLQALHPNRNAPGDSSLMAQRNIGHFDKEAYGKWLQELRKVCTEDGIALIFDEVFVGFRLAKGGAQSYFGVQADMVTYGKTLGGGLPVGVLCGNHQWMRRFNPDKPADFCFARGTFNSHPMVMAAMDCFLRRINEPAIAQMYARQDEFWNYWCKYFNQAMAEAGFPVRFENMSSIWTVSYTAPSRYHWMLQFYLRSKGLALSWVGTGRLIFSLNYKDEDLKEVLRRILLACSEMKADGWWECGFGTAKQINRQIASETFSAFASRFGFNWTPSNKHLPPKVQTGTS